MVSVVLGTSDTVSVDVMCCVTVTVLRVAWVGAEGMSTTVCGKRVAAVWVGMPVMRSK